MEAATIKLSDLSFMTVKVKITKVFWLRAWVAKRLLFMAARVAGCRIKIEDDGCTTVVEK